MPMGRVDNDARTQLAAVDALVTTFPFEIIVSMNAAEPAQLSDLAAAIATMSRPVRIIDSSDRRGAPHARNVGAAAAIAPILAFCDSDDIVRPDWLQKLVDGLIGYEAVGGHLEEFGPDASVEGVRPPVTPGELPTYLGVPYVVSASLAISREWFDKVGGFDATLHRCEDIAIGWDIIRAGGRLGFIPDAIVDYRTRNDLKTLLKQQYHYGIGMSQVLERRGVPPYNGQERKVSMFAANKQAGGKGSWLRHVRRSFIAAGRLQGLVTEKLARR